MAARIEPCDPLEQAVALEARHPFHERAWQDIPDLYHRQPHQRPQILEAIRRGQVAGRCWCGYLDECLSEGNDAAQGHQGHRPEFNL
jgi:hypothetical protein